MARYKSDSFLTWLGAPFLTTSSRLIFEDYLTFTKQVDFCTKVVQRIA